MFTVTVLINSYVVIIISSIINNMQKKDVQKRNVNVTIHLSLRYVPK